VTLRLGGRARTKWSAPKRLGPTGIIIVNFAWLVLALDGSLPP